jgi:type II secretory pathway pseudopilin PulG
MWFRHTRINRRTRWGVTLLELMVVMLIMAIVSVMTLTVAAPALESRRIREAARLVEVAINRSRNRALQNGRAAGIWIERMTNLPEASMTLSYCEVPEIYGGDFPNSGVSIIIENFGPQAYSGNQPGPEEQLAIVVPHLIDPRSFNPATSSGQPFYLNSQLPYMSLDVWATPDPTVQQVVRPGDQIQLNLRGPRFTLESTDNHPNTGYATEIRTRYSRPMWYYARALRRVDAQGRYVFDQNGFYIRDWFHNGAPEVNSHHLHYDNTQNSFGSPAKTTADFFDAPPVRYRIFRQPIKSADPPVILPEGAVIDLNFSGTRRINFHPRLDRSYADPYQLGVSDRNLYGVPPNPYSGYSWRWTDPPPQIFQPQYPNDSSPIIISFNQQGLLDRMYARFWRPYVPRAADSGVRGSWEWGVDRVYEPIHLLVGRREKLPMPAGTEGFNEQVKANWADQRNIWVTINPQTGYIGSAECAEVPLDVVVNGLKGHGTGWGVTNPTPNNATFFDMSNAGRTSGYSNGLFYSGLDHMGYGSRRIANQQFMMGGR